MQRLCKTSQSAVVRARIDPGIKHEAEKALAAMGITVSDAIRIFVTRVATEKAMPFRLRAGEARRLTR